MVDPLPRRRIPRIVEREMKSDMEHARDGERRADFGVWLDIPFKAVIDCPHALRGADGLVVDLAEHDNAVLAGAEWRVGGKRRAPLALGQLDHHPARVVLRRRRRGGDLLIAEMGEGFEAEAAHPTRGVEVDAALALEG